MRRFVMLALVLALGAVASVGVAQARSGSSQGMMYSIQITKYKVNSDHTVSITTKIHGLILAPTLIGKKNVPGKGHWHIYVNGKYNNASGTLTGKTTPLKKGDYKVYTTLNNNDHSPLSEPTRSKTITVMVG